MTLFTITVAYCPAALLARSLSLYQKTRYKEPYRHIVVQGHYPINEKKNSHDIKLITECFDGVELWDPGQNLGSAQSQNWALQRLDIQPGDVFINLDPDAACLDDGWDSKLIEGLAADPNCVLVSCMAPMVQRYLHGAPFTTFIDETDGKYAIPKRPTPFNLSAWRYSFIKEIGGIPQAGLWWGETEGAFWGHCQRTGKYQAYCLDVMEDERGKWMQDRQQAEWKDLHMRVTPDKQFLGNLDEYLRWKYPELSNLDTCRDLNDSNFP